MIKPIHPFPARMAPELALSSLQELGRRSVVLDPMSGSGTVVRHASDLRHRAIGVDMDPLAVLMTKVWTTPIADTAIEHLQEVVLRNAKRLSGREKLPWIADDEETNKFIDFWFAEPQRSDLTRLAYAVGEASRQSLHIEARHASDVLKLALSRIIVTKESGASLARDVSHSRPHRVGETSGFDVLPAFEYAVRYIRRLLLAEPPFGSAEVRLGDARSIPSVKGKEVDFILTSPPYLNAIDYMRGHRLSLVWLGHKLSDLRQIRSRSIGAERGPDSRQATHLFDEIQHAMGHMDALLPRHAQMVRRYAEDVYRLMSEMSRILKPGGKAVLVVGNSCLRGVFIKNSEGVIRAAAMAGLTLTEQTERELPNQSRYLPMPKQADKPLGKRMRSETVLTFKAA